jgi:hypothetical protein
MGEISHPLGDPGEISHPYIGVGYFLVKWYRKGEAHTGHNYSNTHCHQDRDIAIQKSKRT